MHDSGVTNFDFSDAETANEIAQWKEKQHLGVTKKGLGWDGAENSSVDLRLMLQPIAIGHGWRPPGHSSVLVKLDFGEDKKSQAYFTTYVRYSSNGEHWSTWQTLKSSLQAKKGTPDAERSYSGSISVPRMEMNEYRAKQREYSKLDVPWASDEHALCEWIVKSDPKFFETNLPFAGFVQIYVEGSLHGGSRLKSVAVQHTTSTSGLHTPPKDPKARKKREGSRAFWTVKKDAKDPECGFHRYYKPPAQPR